jgi:hypothetical protein
LRVGVVGWVDATMEAEGFGGRGKNLRALEDGGRNRRKVGSWLNDLADGGIY